MDFKKNDIIDGVFNRYKESYKCTLETQNYMPIKDKEVFVSCLRKNMLKDIKQVNREYRKAKRLERREQRRAKKQAKNNTETKSEELKQATEPATAPADVPEHIAITTETEAETPPIIEATEAETEAAEAVPENVLVLENEEAAEIETEIEYSCPIV